MSGEKMLKETAAELKEFLASKNVMGTPVDFGDKALIPVARYGFGFGAGGGQGEKGGGEGAGAGGGIEPVALVILHRDVKGPEGVQVLSVRKDSTIAQVVAILSETLAPQVIEAIKGMNKAPAPKDEKDKE